MGCYNLPPNRNGHATTYLLTGMEGATTYIQTGMEGTTTYLLTGMEGATTYLLTGMGTLQPTS